MESLSLKQKILYSILIGIFGLIILMYVNSRSDTISDDNTIRLGFIIFTFFSSLFFGFSYFYSYLLKILNYYFGIKLEWLAPQFYKIIPEKKWYLAPIILLFFALTVFVSIAIATLFALIVYKLTGLIF